MSDKNNLKVTKEEKFQQHKLRGNWVYTILYGHLVILQKASQGFLANPS